ncbi:MAG: PEP-CTERM sorting domain-containing protein [Rivularia sp. (in: cyanobacteria)]
MKILSKLAILTAGVAVSIGILQTEAKAASFNRIINLDAKQDTNSNPISLDLSAGVYSVDYIGMNDGGMYDAWNAWGDGVTEFCNRNGEGCIKGWFNSYRISFNGFTNMFSGSSVYATASQAMQNAVNTSFSLASDTKVNFFIGDSNYKDNVGGVSLKLSASSQSIPEPTSMLGLLALATVSISTLKCKKQLI